MRRAAAHSRSPFQRMGTAIGRRAVLVGGAGLLGTGLAACSGDGSEGDGDTITIGHLPPWTDTTVMAYLLRRQLQALGHTVELRSFTHLAVAYTALANGDIDIYPSSWERLHAEYVEKYEDSLEDLGVVNSGATSFLAVPEHVGITSVEEVAQDPARFDDRIVGIEPGAGLTALVRSEVMPVYGLEERVELVTSSTPAMLTVLRNAIEDGDDVVVTLWGSSWATRGLSIRGLEDPRGAFGGPESLHVMAREGFTADFAGAAEHIGRIELSDEEFASLEGRLLAESGQGSRAEAVDSWAQHHPGTLPPLRD